MAGLAALLAASAEVYLVVKPAGAAYLCLLGLRALLRPGSEGADERPGAGAGGAWRTGLVADVLNPKIAVFCRGLLPALAPAGLRPAVGMALLVLVHVLLTVVWSGTYVYVLSRAGRFFARPRVRRVLDRATGVVLIGFGVRVATT
ncbi:LysE family translocator [Streptomyces virginiae]